ncbi:hypothetical protein EMMF5_005579 [Cystobasidiomycetes sp. EMM_F5]
MTTADGPSHPASTGDATFTARTPVGSAFTSGLQGAGVGLLVSSVQNSVQKVSAHGMVSALLLAQTDSRSLFVGKQHKQGALGVLTRTGGTIGLFGGMAAIFTYVDATMANVRNTDDALNGAVGGCAAGFLMGVRKGSLPAAFGGCALLGGLIGSFDMAGGQILGNGKQSLSTEEREERRKAFFKKRSWDSPLTQVSQVAEE